MKALITGGSGFIGTHLAQTLRQQRIKNTILDLPSSITDYHAVVNVVKNNFDVIYHLAGISGTVNLDPQKSFATNVQGAVNLLEAVRLYSPRTRIVFSNSRQEYGKPRYLPVDEHHPTNPTNLYGVYKLSITLYAQLYHRLCNLDTVILRTSNVYGIEKITSNHKPNYNIVNHWLAQARTGKDIVIFGNGDQLRDYLYIDDFIEAMLKAGTNAKASGEIFNIGSGRGTTMLKMAQTIAQKYGVKVIKKPWPNDWKTSETGSYVSDISKAKKILHWAPKISFAAAING